MQKDIYIRAVTAERPRLVSLARKLVGDSDEAEDVTQEVLLKLWMIRERIGDEQELARLATTITRNTSVNKRRDRQRNVVMSIDQARHIFDGNMPDKAYEEQENERLLAEAVNVVNDKYRALLNMRNVEGLSYGEIAKVLGTSESSVRGMISKARMAVMENICKLRNERKI